MYSCVQAAFLTYSVLYSTLPAVHLSCFALLLAVIYLFHFISFFFFLLLYIFLIENLKYNLTGQGFSWPIPYLCVDENKHPLYGIWFLAYQWKGAWWELAMGAPSFGPRYPCTGVHSLLGAVWAGFQQGNSFIQLSCDMFFSLGYILETTHHICVVNFSVLVYLFIQFIYLLFNVSGTGMCTGFWPFDSYWNFFLIGKFNPLCMLLLCSKSIFVKNEKL